MTCGEVFSPPHDHHHGMPAPFMALERRMVALPLLLQHYGRPYTYPLVWMLRSALIKRNRAVQGRGAALEAVERCGW